MMWLYGHLATCLCVLTSSFAESEHTSRPTIEFPLILTRQVMQNSSSISFASTWEILGPFRIGTREAAWGADPLEYYGGFRNLEYDSEASYSSSLPIDGIVKWSTLEAESVQIDPLGAKANLFVSFPQIQWEFLQDVYGWAAVQFQGWARGYVTISGSEAQSFILYTDSVLEFWIGDNQYFGGDFYTFRKAPPVIWLEPGRHRLDVRLVRDVRAFGGIGQPSMAIALQLNKTSETLELASTNLLISDLVNGKLASSLASVTVRNSGKRALNIAGIRGQDGSIEANLLEPDFSVLPGQTRPIAFNLTSTALNISEIRISIDYSFTDATETTLTLPANQTLKRKDLYEPHKVTFLHPGGIISYAMLRPPQQNATCNTDDKLPVLFYLHGAGNEAEADPVSRAFDPVTDICSWVLLPTGVTPWSADDWHNWGFADIEAAAAAIETWITTVGWSGPGVDIQRWFVVGHSNGGQGTWYGLTHRPDNVIAAAPVSGYLSIQTYVPYHLWRLTDPRLVSIIQASTNSYRHELLIGNAKGIPIHQQHGGVDSNVPAYNSRSMHQLIAESGWSSNYTELTGSEHYFDGVMTTPNLQAFYRQYLRDPPPEPEAVDNFILTVANPGDTGSKQGFKVALLQDPGQLGRLYVTIDKETGDAIVRTSNVLRLSVASDAGLMSLQLDGQSVSATPNDSEQAVYFQLSEGTWEVLPATETNSNERIGRQLGPLDAIMRSSGRFTIRYLDKDLEDIALQISRNLHQYYYADAEIRDTADGGANSTGNVFTIAYGSGLTLSDSSFPISVDNTGISIQDAYGNQKVYSADQGVAALFLRPRENEALELVVWAADVKDVAMAARLVPIQTGVGQPDFVILKKEALWKGIDGVLAAGFFDHEWKVSNTSYLS